MTSVDVDLPEGWRVHPSQKQDELVLARFRYHSPTGTTFIVAIESEPPAEGACRLRFSTETPTNVRHDYPVSTYESRADAETAAESFIEHVARRLRQGKISPSDPDIETVQNEIQSFTDESTLTSLRRAVQRFRTRHSPP